MVIFNSKYSVTKTEIGKLATADLNEARSKIPAISSNKKLIKSGFNMNGCEVVPTTKVGEEIGLSCGFGSAEKRFVQLRLAWELRGGLPV